MRHDFTDYGWHYTLLDDGDGGVTVLHEGQERRLVGSTYKHFGREILRLAAWKQQHEGIAEVVNVAMEILELPPGSIDEEFLEKVQSLAARVRELEECARPLTSWAGEVLALLNIDGTVEAAGNIALASLRGLFDRLRELEKGTDLRIAYLEADATSGRASFDALARKSAEQEARIAALEAENRDLRAVILRDGDIRRVRPVFDQRIKELEAENAALRERLEVLGRVADSVAKSMGGHAAKEV